MLVVTVKFILVNVIQYSKHHYYEQQRREIYVACTRKREGEVKLHMNSTVSLKHER